MRDLSLEMHDYYRERAPYYDAVYLKPERQLDIQFLSNYLSEQLANRDVLEIACGTGYWTQHIAKSAQSILATDGIAEPLEFAKLRPRHRCNVSFLLANAYSLTSEIGPFNACFAGLWYSHVPVESRNTFFSGLNQCLTPGSKIIFIDNNHTQLRDFPIVETDSVGNTYQHRSLNDGSVHRVLKNFPNQRDLVELVSPFATQMHWCDLENFWLFEYVFTGVA